MKNQFIIIVGVALTLVACGGPAERKAKYLARAQGYLEAGNFPKARVALQNVLIVDSKYAAAYYLLAQVEEKEKNWRNAVGLYQQVVQLAPDHADALIRLAKYYLEARLTDLVVVTADKVLATDPLDSRANALKIAVLALDGQQSQAMSQAEALRSQFPAEPDVAILLATLYGKQQRYRDAETILRHALETHPKDIDLLNNLSTILVQAKDMDGAETVARRMIETEPALFDHRIRLARFFDEQGAPEKAEGILREASALDPQSEERHLVLADFLGIRKATDAAELVLLEAATRLPDSTKIQFALATIYEAGGKIAKAREQYAKLVEGNTSKPVSLEAKIKLAEMDLILGNQAEATRQVHEILKESPHSADGLILSGRLALARGNGKDAAQTFRTVLRGQPESAALHFLLGQAYRLTGETDLAKGSFERAVALYPGQVEARHLLAALESQGGHHREARARLEGLLKQRPDDVDALELLLNLDLVTKNWDEAERMLTRLNTLSKDPVIPLMAKGRLRQAQGRLDKAGAAYEHATVLAPNDPEPLLHLVKLDMVQHDAGRARTRLDAVLAAQPDHLFAHGLMGEVLALTGYPQDADIQFQEAVRLNPKWITPWLDRGELWLSQKQPGRAVQVIQAGLKVNPDSEELHMLLASAYSTQGLIDLAIDAYDGALRLNPRNVLAANNVAVLLVDYKGDPLSAQKAFALSRDFEKDAPHPLFLDTLGWVQFKMGQQEEGLRLMRKAVAESPEVPILNYHLGVAYHRSGNTAEARVYLSKALKSAEAFHGRHEAEQILSQMRG